MELHRALGLTDDESQAVSDVLGRQPNPLELAMYAVMWSEHCSYKSSRIHLGRLPSKGDRVLVGPGENAGVIDAGGGIAIAMRIESHNHPSAVEPYQGAATGVGGILRDIFTMGARPIALMDSLRLGPLEDDRSRFLFEGIVRGISGYGNSVGVPTVGGEVVFSPSYSRNPLVNVACLGLLPVSRLVLGAASGVGNLAVLLGSSTGRDGIGGVSVLASAELSGASGADGAKRPSVQVGDPFEEKRLIEACLELLQMDLVVGLQDLGGGGLTCAASEAAARAGVGLDLDVTAMVQREPGMVPAEVMTSESQERMLAIVQPEGLEAVLALCRRWEVNAAVVGVVTDPIEGVGRLRILDGPGGRVLADVSAASLSQDAPRYDRPRRPPADLAQRLADDPVRLDAPGDAAADLRSMLADTSWVWEQYDHQLFLNTVVGPGGDAALLRLDAPGVPGDRMRGLALTTDGSGRWCAVEPRAGAAMAVAEATLNLACAGASPAALVDCLNLGNPEHPEVAWQLSEVIDGIAQAATALAVPVIGGNVSLYNSADGQDIDPTPVIGAVGLVERLAARHPGTGLRPGGTLILLGPRSRALGGSRWAVELRGHGGGTLPPLDLSLHAAVVEVVASLVSSVLAGEGGEDLVSGVHDVSEGGLAVCLAEMAVAGGAGARVEGIAGHGELFSEAASRVVVCTSQPSEVLAAAAAGGVPAVLIGRAGGDDLEIVGLIKVSLGDLSGAWRERIPAAMANSAVSAR